MNSNNRIPKAWRLIVSAAAVIWLAACATTSVDPSVLDNAHAAIDQAEAAGAEEYSPLELRFARDYLTTAEIEIEDGNGDEARRLADRAEVEALLALARTRAALARADLARKEREFEQTRDDLVEAFGEEVLEQ